FPDMLSFPGCISSAVSVGCTSKYDTICNFSNRAPFLSLWAPGLLIYSSVPGNQFTYFSGTSMSTPHVTGAWAVLKSYAPSSSVDRILGALQSTGRAMPFASSATRIRIWNAARLLRCGDAVLDDRESCDDGNLNSGDGCEADCLYTPCATSVNTS